MSGADLGVVLGVVGTVLGGAGTFLGFLYMRRRDARTDLKVAEKLAEEAKTERDATHSLAASAHEVAVTAHAEAQGLRVEVTEQGSRVSVLESKMDVFWRNVALDVSKILHSPHAGWENLDALLEKFQHRLITTPEMNSLEEQLRDMVEGRWEAAPVLRADQVAASLLLRAIEQTRGTGSA